MVKVWCTRHGRASVIRVQLFLYIRLRTGIRVHMVSGGSFSAPGTPAPKSSLSTGPCCLPAHTLSCSKKWVLSSAPELPTTDKMTRTSALKKSGKRDRQDCSENIFADIFQPQCMAYDLASPNARPHPRSTSTDRSPRPSCRALHLSLIKITAFVRHPSLPCMPPRGRA